MNRELRRITQVLLVIFCQIRNTLPLELLLLHSCNINLHFEEELGRVNGAGRALHLLKMFRENAEKGIGPPVLYLSAGYNFSQTRSYSADQWEIVADFLNLLKPDAMSLGDHELYLEVQNLTRFLQRLIVPVVACNIDVGASNVLKKYLRPSSILEINNHKIGIVGTIATRMDRNLLPESMHIKNELESVRKECWILHDLGVDIIIVLSHAGRKIDEVIARVVDHVDVVVGCGVNITNNWKSTNVIRRKDGRYVSVIGEIGFTKSLSVLQMRFDQNGEIIKYSGEPILLGSKIAQTKDMLSLHKRTKRNSEEVSGISVVTLSAECEKRECNFGNLIADALIDHKSHEYYVKAEKPWTDYPIAMINAGMMLRLVRKHSNLTSHLERFLTYDDTVVYVKLRGRHVRRALLEGTLSYGRPQGYFLQFSGLHVRYNLTKPLKDRITRIVVRCGICDVPVFESLKDRLVYHVIINSMTYKNMDTFRKFKLAVSQRYIRIGEIVEGYVKKYQNITLIGDEGRLIIEERAIRSIVSQQILILLCIILVMVN